MKPFCELVVQEIFPAVRALIAKELMFSLNYTQMEAGEKMGVTQPAISQYQRELRGKKVKLIKENEKVSSLIKQSAKELAKSNNPYNSIVLCNICKEIRKTGLLCKLHREAIPALETCNICLTDNIQCKI